MHLWRAPCIILDLHQRMIKADLEHLTGTKELILKEKSSSALPSREFEALVQYMSSNIKAVELILQEAASFRDANESDHLVQEATVVINNIDPFYFQIYQFNTLIRCLFDEDLDPIQELKTAHQTIDFYMEKDTDDICLYLDDVYQQCRVCCVCSIVLFFFCLIFIRFVPNKCRGITHRNQTQQHGSFKLQEGQKNRKSDVERKNDSNTTNLLYESYYKSIPERPRTKHSIIVQPYHRRSKWV